jgi:hypothetical protein
VTPAAPSSRGRLWRILRLPLAIFLATAAGLAAALLGDGWWHGLSWLLLALPLVVIVNGVFGGRDKP